MKIHGIDGSNPVPIKCAKYNYLTWKDMPTEEHLYNYYTTTYLENNKWWYNPENDYNFAGKHGSVLRVKNTIERFASISINTAVVHDIGCSFGGLVAALREAGFTAFGTDLNSAAIQQGRARGNEYVFDVPLKDFLKDKASPDIFVSNHALEHFIDPLAFMKETHGLFGDNSIGCFAWPNGNSYPSIVRKYERHGWNGYPDHLHLLGPYASFRLLMDSGFVVLDASSGAYGDFNADNIKHCLSPFNPNAVINYESFSRALEENFAAAELVFVFCRKNSSLAERNREAVEKSLALFRKFEEAGL